MAEQTETRMQRAINVIIRMQKFDEFPAAAVESFMPYIRKDAELLLAEIDGPEPTWRDVIRAVRSAGWTGRGGRWRMWGSRSSEDVNDQHGWVIRHQFLRTVKFTVVGPGTGHLTDRSYTELINPTPAKVLAAARLVGLGGSE